MTCTSNCIIYFAPSVDRNIHKSVQLFPAPIYLFRNGGVTLWLWAGRVQLSTSQSIYLSSNGILLVFSWLLVKKRGSQWACSLPGPENLTRRRVPTTRFGRKEKTCKNTKETCISKVNWNTLKLSEMAWGFLGNLRKFILLSQIALKFTR